MKNALLSHSDKKKEKEEVKPKKKPTQPKTTTPRISRVMNSAYQSPARERSTKATKAPSRNGERARSQTSKYPRSQVVSRKQSTSALSKKRTKKNEETINITPSFKKHNSPSSDEKETQPFRGITDEERNAEIRLLGYHMDSNFRMPSEVDIIPSVFIETRTRTNPLPAYQSCIQNDSKFTVINDIMHNSHKKVSDLEDIQMQEGVLDMAICNDTNNDMQDDEAMS